MIYEPELPTTNHKYASHCRGGMCARDLYNGAPVQRLGLVQTPDHRRVIG
jgi:hypothetical protein